LELLAEVCRERSAAVLLVTHDPLATAFADRVYALQDGHMVDYEPDNLFVPVRAPEATS
jgi:putative ABC transport system ATP-binding protein